MMKTKQGFTLIELVISLALLSIFALMATQLEKNWFDMIKVNETKFSLNTAFGIAKSTALSNQQSNSIGSILVIVPNYVCVKTSPTASVDCNSEYKWKKDLPATVSISTSTSLCIALDNTGIITSSGTCQTTMNYTITRGKQSVQSSFI